MSSWGKNIRKIRVAKKMSQTQFAELFGLQRTTVGAYEEGRAEAKVDTMINVSEYFNISIDNLLKKELTVNDILHFDENYLSANNQKIPFINVDTLENVLRTSIEVNFSKLPGLNLSFFVGKIDLLAEYYSKIENRTSINFNEGDIFLCTKNFSGEGVYLDVENIRINFINEADKFYSCNIFKIVKILKQTRI